MIPIFPFASLAGAIGLLATLFPGLFPAVGNVALGLGYGLGATVNNTTRTIKRVLGWSLIALVFWLGLIAFAIHTQSWVFAVTAFVSIALAVTVLMLMLAMAKSAIGAGMAQLLATATTWSAAIKLQTVPFARQNYKLARILGSPLYGLYLLLALPAKAVLEVVKVVASFGPTLTGWMQRVVEIMSAASVVAWVLATIVMLQLQHNVIILTLPLLGALLIIIALLINLIFLGFAPKIKVKEFIALLGYSGILLNALFVTGIVFPPLTFTLARKLATWSNTFLVNLAADDFMSCLVGLVVINVLCGIVVWARKAAVPLAMAWILVSVWGFDLTVIEQSAPFEVPAGTVVRQCNACDLPGANIDPTKVERAIALLQPQSYIAVDQISPRVVEFQRGRFLVAHPAVDNNSQAGFRPETWLVAWDAVPAQKTLGLRGFSWDWTSYGRGMISVLGLLLASAYLALSNRAKKPAATPAPAGGGHGHHP
jgi:hypothetical protein